MNHDTYALDMSWGPLLVSLGVRPVDVLRRAGLPDDLFARPSARLASSAYFRLWEAIEAETSDPTFPLRLLRSVRSESFSPPLFAALCSPDLRTALGRLRQYKPLVGPMRLEVLERGGDNECSREVIVELTWLALDDPRDPPPTLVAAELAFLVGLARMGTHEMIRPLRLTLATPPPALDAWEAFVGAPIRRDPKPTITFRGDDASRPFLSSSDALWEVFEPELRRRLAALDVAATMTARVRATLLEGLPSGQLSMDEVARRVALSKRTLQRRLVEEGTSYLQILRDTRLSLAHHYLERTHVPLSEIAFLLGFDEPSSFFRAFHEWTGTTPEATRRAARVGG